MQLTGVAFLVDGKNIPKVDFDVGENYAGLLPNTPSGESSLFFWFFPSDNPDACNEVGHSTAHLKQSNAVDHRLAEWWPRMQLPRRSAPRERTLPLAVGDLPAHSKSVLVDKPDQRGLHRSAGWRWLFASSVDSPERDRYCSSVQ